jgi:hypothetical protein
MQELTDACFFSKRENMNFYSLRNIVSHYHKLIKYLVNATNFPSRIETNRLSYRQTNIVVAIVK